ncbi:antirestriction protein ArdA [Crossiella sp. CA198]|uniref:antirestriction protein ArdA n=1 Tax=Crossiella sp. CA198 TaxID=3455607 RepID=UPI003F8D0BD0
MNYNTPRIRVCTFDEYIEGTSLGHWIDATQEPDIIREQVAKIAGRDAADVELEWVIREHGAFRGVEIEWHADWDTVSRIAKGIAEYGDTFAAYVLAFRGHFPEQHFGQPEAELWEDRTRGRWLSFEEFAMSELDAHEFPEWINSNLSDLMLKHLRFDFLGYAEDFRKQHSVVQLDDWHYVFNMSIDKAH